MSSKDLPGNRESSTGELLLRYLASPEARPAVLEELTLRPSEAFEAIRDFRGPYPEGSNPVEIMEGPIYELLEEFLRRFPELLIAPDSVPRPPPPYLLISAVIAVGDPRFADIILRALEDRSVSTKLLAVDGITRCAFLRTPSVKVKLEKLMAMKSIARYPDALNRVQKALDSFDSRPVHPG